MRQPTLLDKIRSQTSQCLNGYIRHDACEDWESYITSPHFSDDAGVVGALALAHQALELKQESRV